MNRIKSFAFVAAVAVMAAASVTISAAQGKNLDFKLVNKTGLTIDKIYVSPTNDEKWGEDVMGRDVLNNGETVEIKFSTGETECNWDLKIVDAEKDSVIWTKINLCTAEEITLKYENKTPTAIIK